VVQGTRGDTGGCIEVQGTMGDAGGGIGGYRAPGVIHEEE
jgi:hypothetical protein